MIISGNEEDFRQEYRNCEIIEGDLIISDTTVQNLRFFNRVEYVTGKLSITLNSKLTTMEKAFPALHTVDDGIEIDQNLTLFVISQAFSALESTKGVLINNNKNSKNEKLFS